MDQDQVGLPKIGEEVPQASGLPPIGAEMPKELQPVTVGPALKMQAVAQAVPLAAKGAMELATNPSVVKASAKAGRILGGVTAAASALGAATAGNPTGATTGVLAIPGAAWAGGKAGWFGGRMLQNMTVPVAKALEVITPYLQTVSTLSGAQGVNDLAQMAEPERKDIGVLGVGASTPHDEAHPALLNLLAMKAQDAVKSLVASGVKAADASTALGILRQYMKAK